MTHTDLVTRLLHVLSDRWNMRPNEAAAMLVLDAWNHEVYQAGRAGEPMPTMALDAPEDGPSTAPPSSPEPAPEPEATEPSPGSVEELVAEVLGAAGTFTVPFVARAVCVELEASGITADPAQVDTILTGDEWPYKTGGKGLVWLPQEGR